MTFFKSLTSGTALVMAGLATAMLLGGCVAMRQDLDPIKSDVAVLEKQLMDVQRQVAEVKAGAAVEAPPTPARAAGESPDTLSRLSAVEKRLDALESKAAAESVAPAPAAPQPMAPEPVIIEPVEEAPKAPAPAPEGPAPGAAGAVTPGGIYKESLDAYNAGDYEKAESGFSRFLEGYPADLLADNARFWLGETYFGKKDYGRALKEYGRVLSDYPQGDKVPDALYRMGVAYEELGQPAKAREAYTRVMDNYPYSDAAKKARRQVDKLK